MVTLWTVHSSGLLAGQSKSESVPNAANPVITASPASLSVNSFGTWPTYLFNNQRTGADASERTLSPANASQLSLAWHAQLNQSVMGSLIATNGTVYVGDWSGHLNALFASNGTILNKTIGKNSQWSSPALGTPSYSTCGSPSTDNQFHFGITSTGTDVAGGTLFINGGNTWSWAVNSSTGLKLWHADVANRSATKWYYDYEWGSPLIYNGYAYVGTSALCEYNDSDPNGMHWKYVQGQLLQISLSTHAIVHVFNVTKGASSQDVGGAIWSMPSIDPVHNVLWLTTGNENSSSETYANGEYPRSVLALNATTLQLLGGCQVGTVGTDQDFGAAPILFHDSGGNTYIGALNKNGVLCAFNATRQTGGTCVGSSSGTLIKQWNTTSLGTGTNRWSGDISPLAFDGNDLYVSTGGSNGALAGTVYAYSPTGSFLWSHTLTYGTCGSPPSPCGYTTYAGLASANGLLIVGANNDSSGNGSGRGLLLVLNASSGALLYEYSFNELINGEPIVYDGEIIVGTGWLNQGNFSSAPGWVDAFRIPLTVASYGLGTGSCQPGPPSPCSPQVDTVTFNSNPGAGMPPYTCSWTFGDGGTSNVCGPTHTYTSAGNLTATLTVTDYAGGSVSRQVYFQILFPPPPSPGFVGVNFVSSFSLCKQVFLVCPPGPGQPVPLSFSTQPFGGTGSYTYDWNFGDGSAHATTQSPTHTYSNGGLTFIVTLTVTQAGAQSPTQFIVSFQVTT